MPRAGGAIWIASLSPPAAVTLALTSKRRLQERGSNTWPEAGVRSVDAASCTDPDRSPRRVNDDVEIASYLGLTTINQSLYESGREGARLLPLRLSLRHTTAPPRAE
jgi:hypothetical protein